jgi:hypothetical protein
MRIVKGSGTLTWGFDAISAIERAALIARRAVKGTLRIVKGPGPLTWLFVAISAIHGATAWTNAAQAETITLAVLGRSNTTPWVASAGSFVAVTWAASVSGKGDVYLATSRDGGRNWGQPVRVNRAAADARVSGEIPPRVALRPIAGGLPEIAVTWNAREGGAAIRTARSRDGGRTFTTPVTLQAPGAAGDRGWHASAIDDKGAVHTIWLDHRGLAATKAGDHSGHKGDHDGVAMAQRSALYYGAARAGAERELFKGVCYCCKTAMVAAPGGVLYAAWRHVFDGNLRDIAFTSSRDGGRTFSPMARVHQDGWAINGCPDDGPAMAVDASGTVHMVWPTLLNGTDGTLLYATAPGGKTFGPPIRVPTLGSPKPAHPQIAIDGAGRPVIAWDEVRNGVRTAALRRAAATGDGPVTFGPIQTLSDGTSSYPVLAAVPDGLIAVWTSGASDRAVIAVQRIK